MKFLKSKTINFALLLAITEPVLESFPQLRDFLGDNYGIVFAILAAVVGGLRAVTNKPLSEK